MNFGIIGFGKIAHKFVQSIQGTTEGKVTAIGSSFFQENDSYLIQHPEIKLYDDYNELLEDSTIDAVYIALPHILHYEWSLKALQKKIPVLCEKPAFLTLDEIDSIQKVSEKNHTYFMEALKTKFNDGMKQLKKDIQYIGNIQEIHVGFCFDAFSRNNHNTYLFDPKQGGALNDVGPYVIGFTFALLEENIIDVHSRIQIREGVESNFQAEITLKNNTKAYLEGAIDNLKDRNALLVGEKGNIEISIFNRPQNYVIKMKNGKIIERNIPIVVGDDMTMEIQSFIDDVKEKKIASDIHSLNDTRAIIKIVDMIRKNAIYSEYES